MLSVIMPAYNEEGNLAKTIKETTDALKKNVTEYEIIVIDDGSHDNTYETALYLAQNYPGVRSLSYKVNMGRGYALKYGCNSAQGDLILFIDADHELPPSQILRFLDHQKETNADVVNGSKMLPQSQVRGPFVRKFLSKGYNLLIRALCINPGVSDVLSAVKLFRKEVLIQALPKTKVKGFAFDLELLFNVRRLGYSIVEVPIDLNYHFNPMVSIKGIPRIFWDTLAIFCRAKLFNSYDK